MQIVLCLTMQHKNLANSPAKVPTQIAQLADDANAHLFGGPDCNTAYIQPPRSPAEAAPDLKLRTYLRRYDSGRWILSKISLITQGAGYQTFR